MANGQRMICFLKAHCHKTEGNIEYWVCSKWVVVRSLIRLGYVLVETAESRKSECAGQLCTGQSQVWICVFLSFAAAPYPLWKAVFWWFGQCFIFLLGYIRTTSDKRVKMFVLLHICNDSARSTFGSKNTLLLVVKGQTYVITALGRHKNKYTS